MMRITNVNRLRIADERALRANIRKLIEDLYALPDVGRSAHFFSSNLSAAPFMQ